MLNRLRHLAELQVLSKADKKSAFQYAYYKRLKHWQYWGVSIAVFAVGLTICNQMPIGMYRSIAVGLIVTMNMIITNYTTKSIFRDYVVEHIQMLKLSRNSSVEIK